MCRYLAVAAVLSLPLGATAQVYNVVPNVYPNSGGSGYSNTLDGQTGNPWTIQLIWSANQLTSIVGSEITGITYRLGRNLPGGYPLVTTTWSDYRISLAPSVAPAQASTTIADNFLLPPTQVRS